MRLPQFLHWLWRCVRYNWSEWVLVAALWLVVLANFDGRVWLSGWDNLHPEFYPEMNLSRSLWAAWQEYQGLGLLGGMGHAADGVRQLLIWAMVQVMPPMQVRMVLALAMVVIGPMGVFRLVRDFFRDRDVGQGQVAGLLAGAYYVFNYGTVQNFYVPFDPYYWFYGFLPWLMWSVYWFLRSGTKKWLALFGLVSVLATPLGYLQTAFVVYVMVLGVVLFGEWIERWLGEGGWRSKLKWSSNPVKVGMTVLVTNAFWLLPVAYFSITSASVTIDSKINQIATKEVYLANQGYANLSDIARLKGYWWGMHDAAEGGEFEYLMEGWRNFDEQSIVVGIGYAAFLLMLAGSVYAVWKRMPWRWGLVGIFGLVLVMLMGEKTWLIGGGVTWLRESIPLFGQMFRSSYTKWVVPAAWIYAVLFGLGGAMVYGFLANVHARIGKGLGVGLAVVMVGILGYGVAPIFNGELFYKRVLIEIPDRYFELFEYMKHQDRQKRVAFFPAQTHWGWNFYDWGYRGSGFLWYGIEQPILDRAFDVWSQYNETFYNEFSRAIYNEDSELLAKVVKKYQVSYVLFDGSVNDPGLPQELMYKEEMRKNLNAIGAVQVWGDELLGLYDVSGVKKQEEEVVKGLVALEVKTEKTGKDLAYQMIGKYMTGYGGRQWHYPFMDVFREQVEGVGVVEDEGGMYLEVAREIKRGEGVAMTVPAFSPGYIFNVQAEVEHLGRLLRINFPDLIEVTVGEDVVAKYGIPVMEVEVPNERSEMLVAIQNKTLEIGRGEKKLLEGIRLELGAPVEVNLYEPLGYKIDVSEEAYSSNGVKCWERQGFLGQIAKEVHQGEITLVVRDASVCLPIKIGEMVEVEGLVRLGLPFRSTGESRPHFCVTKQGAEECLHEEVFYRTKPSTDWSRVQRDFVMLEGEVYWVNIVGRPINVAGMETRIEYQPPQLVKYDLIHKYVMPSGVWSDFFNAKEFEIGTEGRVSVKVRTLERSVDLTSESKLEYESCGLFGMGSVQKEVLASGLKYEVKGGGAGCDYVVLDDLSSRTDRVVVVRGNNLSGRGVKVAFSTIANQKNVAEWLTPRGEFTSFYSLPGWGKVEDRGYRLMLENKTFGVEVAESIISEIDFFSLPLDWLGLIRIGLTEVEVADEVVGEPMVKWGTGVYEAGVRGSGVLVLSQGYDEGWLGFEIDPKSQSVDTRLVRLFPGWFGQRMQQVKVNGWANGFVVGGQKLAAGSQEGQSGGGKLDFGNMVGGETERRIVLIYWPQYLEWLGLGMLATVLVGLGGRLVFPRYRRAFHGFKREKSQNQ